METKNPGLGAYLIWGVVCPVLVFVAWWAINTYHPTTGWSQAAFIAAWAVPIPIMVSAALSFLMVVTSGKTRALITPLANAGKAFEMWAIGPLARDDRWAEVHLHQVRAQRGHRFIGARRAPLEAPIRGAARQGLISTLLLGAAAVALVAGVGGAATVTKLAVWVAAMILVMVTIVKIVVRPVKADGKNASTFRLNLAPVLAIVLWVFLVAPAFQEAHNTNITHHNNAAVALTAAP